MLERFRGLIEGCADLSPQDQRLQIEAAGRLATYYAPFEHVQRGAKIVIVGITPGPTQASGALRALRAGLQEGLSEADALGRAKGVASFSGPLRQNLVEMLDHVGLHGALGLASSADLFAAGGSLAHFTSVLRYPVFLDGKPYAGNPPIWRTPALKAQADRWFAEELDSLPDAYWIPLGVEPADVLRRYVAAGRLRADRLLDDMIHPSPQSIERVMYFLGRKPREKLSSRTNADIVDGKVARLRAKLGDVSAEVAQPGPPPSAERPAPTPAQRRPGPRQPAKPAGSPAHHLPASALRMLSERFGAAHGTSKLGVFTLPNGEHVAVDLAVQRIQVWTCDAAGGPALGTRVRYPADRARHHHLRAHAPALAQGQRACLWSLPDLGSLGELATWVASLPPR